MSGAGILGAVLEFCLLHLLEGRDWALLLVFNSLSFLPQAPCDGFALLSEVLFICVFLSDFRFLLKAS